METRTLIRIGAFSGLAVAVTQIVGNALHPPMPTGPVDSIQVIQQTTRWVPVHLLITFSYFLFIPFALGAAAAFRNRPATVRIATPLVLIGAALGAAQIATHLTIFHRIAQLFATADDALRSSLAAVYDVIWKYSVALEVAHLQAIYVAIVLFGIAMMREPAFKRWTAWLGIAAGVIATSGMMVGKFIVIGRVGDLIFGGSLLPLMVWIIASSIMLLRIKDVPAYVPTERVPQPA